MRVLLLVVLLLASPAKSDDIDIYLEAISGPRRLVLAIDWQGLAAAGQVDTVVNAIAASMDAHAAALAGLGQPVRLDVSLLRPPGFDCGTWPGCATDAWSLSPPRSITVEWGRASLSADLDQLAAAAVTSPAYSPYDYALSLDAVPGAGPDHDYCDATVVLHLLWSDVAATPPPDPLRLAGIRNIVIAPWETAGVDALATQLGAETAQLSSPAELPGRLADLLLSARQAGASLQSASVPGFTPDLPGLGEEVLFPLFRPSGQYPWPGNLKALKLVLGESGAPVIASAPLARPPRRGLDPADGGIDRGALTFWTDPSGADVQGFNPAQGEIAGADGRSVLRGGVAQSLPGSNGGIVGDANDAPGARRLYVLTGEPGAPLPALDVGMETARLLGLPTDTALDESLALLRWIRGQDVLDEDNDGDSGEPRRWLLGSVMHSRPAILDYGPRPRPGLPVGVPDRRVLVGSNDGLLRLLDISERGDPAEEGLESWAALPAALLSLQRFLQQPDGGPGHRYGVDGSPVVYREDRNGDGVYEADDGDRVWAYQSLRRGGRQLYAIDLSDPDAPRLLWQVGPNAAGFAPLALGFSTPRLARLDLGESRPRLALVFGGGYHGGWQSGARVGKDAGGGTDALGNALFVVDAETGELLWRAHGPPHVARTDIAAEQLNVAAMRHGIAAPVTLLDSNDNGYTDRAYVADSGGHVWRLDMIEAGRAPQVTGTAVLAGWQFRQVAALGGIDVDDRRFFHALDVARTRDGLGDYEALLLISGDRAHPDDAVVSNHAYLVKDRGLAGAPISHDQLPDVTDSCRDHAAGSCVGLDLARGWRLRLQAPGEKGLAPPLLRSGSVYFTTYRPPLPDARGCRQGIGTGALYAVRLREAAPALVNLYRQREDPDEPLPAQDARAVIVGEGIPGPVVPWRQYLLLPGNGVDGRSVVDPGGRMRWRTHWRENGVD